MTGNTSEFTHDHSKSICPVRNFDSQEFFSAKTKCKIVSRRIEIIQTIRHRDDVHIAFVLRSFFDSGMQVPYLRLSGLDNFAIHFQDDTKHPMGTRVLRTHVEGHRIFIALQQSLFSYTHEVVLPSRWFRFNQFAFKIPIMRKSNGFCC